MMSIARAIFPIFLLIIPILIASNLTSCSHSINNPQAYISLTVGSKNQVDGIRNLIAKFASENGYTHHTVADVPNLKLTGQFVDGFHDEGFNNYITSTNFKDIQCIGVAIYSSDGTSKAIQTRDALSLYVQQNNKYKITVTKGDVCQSKEFKQAGQNP